MKRGVGGPPSAFSDRSSPVTVLLLNCLIDWWIGFSVTIKGNDVLHNIAFKPSVSVNIDAFLGGGMMDLEWVCLQSISMAPQPLNT